MRYLICLLAFAAMLSPVCAQEKADVETKRYEQRHRMVPGGTGRYYMDREIAHVVSGNETVKWLERPDREQEEDTSKMIQLLALKPGEKAADIGAGTGYISRRIAAAVGPKGTVYAQELQQEMLDIIRANMQKHNYTNVVYRLGNEQDPKLPASTLDLIVMVDVYHEFTYPYEMTVNMVKALKPGGRLVWVEFKAEDKSVPIYEAHKMSVVQIKKEALVHPELEWTSTHSELPWQHVITFTKKKTPAKK